MELQYKISRSLTLPAGEFRFRFSRSGGPGGQNVNKVSSRVELLFDVAHSPSLTAFARDRLLDRLGDRVDDEGVLHLVVDQSRSQWQNREIAVEKAVLLLRDGLVPRRVRVPTHATRVSKLKRRQTKKVQGLKKQMRRRPDLDL
jgi:ribosome-associated protein